MTDERKREGDVALTFDPGHVLDGTVAFIGHLSTPWQQGHCPKNLTEARSLGGPFHAHVKQAYRDGLAGLGVGAPVILLYWMGSARRDLILQAPAHKPAPTGTFALRSPARPNPIALAVVRLLAIDAAAGVLTIDSCDAFDGTPLIDIKPWLPGVDLPPGFAVGSTA
ncbi:TrmO family methyltransferase domain-containing protein [Neotabrizicola shimadae]|uniref:SAM-dependent methyltransferase n=1 Tax=Neotabrizicola shimadae TaxID=2807096 RepID=A0A8G0ZSB9_9RHOB|nr:TrmO family methyltransferase [Neotabrizicola shimadae]QYZ69559.1 SAM-dependent methyltransferase [Neotabrizicola shimadae]